MIGKTVRDVTVPPLIVGDSAFPLRSWLLKPYTNAVLTPQQHYFNYCLSRARMVTEAAYGQLEGRWRVLFRKNESSRDQARITTLACMVLHNTCIMQGDVISTKLDLSRWKWWKEEQGRIQKVAADERLSKHKGCFSGGSQNQRCTLRNYG